MYKVISSFDADSLRIQQLSVYKRPKKLKKCEAQNFVGIFFITTKSFFALIDGHHITVSDIPKISDGNIAYQDYITHISSIDLTLKYWVVYLH